MNEWGIEDGAKIRSWSAKIMEKGVKLKTVKTKWVWYYKFGSKYLIQARTLDFISLQAHDLMLGAVWK